MYDRQTDSQWVQVTGEAKTGPYKGTVLRFIPSTVTTWQMWKTTYPGTKVLPGIGRGEFIGTYRGFNDMSEFGLAITHFNQAKLYEFVTLKKSPVINDTFQDQPVIIVFNRDQKTATAWKRTVNGKVLTFRAEDDPEHGFVIADNETNSRWDPFTGRSIDGPYLGVELPSQTNTPIMVDRFKVHYPEGEIYTNQPSLR